MSFNGSGTFVINTAGQPVVANTVISATVFNALTADLATGLSTCITKDGQTTITANIPFGSNKITGLGAATAATDAATFGQVQSTAAKLITVTGTDTITGTMSPALTAYAAGQLFYFIANAANTGAMTINIDGLGAKAITRDGSTALIAGDVNTGEIVVICYDGTRFQMINAANSFGNTTINGTLTVTGNTGLQANVSITSTLSVGGTFAVTGAATLGSTLSVTGKSDLPVVSTASMNAAVAVITTGTVTNLTSTSASIASMNAGVALLTNATVTTLTATGASIASANIGNLQFTAASIASINAGVAVITNLTATGASIASMNAGVALLTTATVTNLTATGASIASANAGNLQVTGASVASANVGVALITTGTVTALTATGASIGSANVGTAVVTGLTVTNASIASANAGTATLSGNLTLNGGTANGVLYLNGSKVATSGSALTFDGTNLGVGTASPGSYRLNVQGGTSSFTYNAANQYAGEFYNNSATGYGVYIQGGGAGSRAALNVLDYAGASILYAGNGNNVGIGTSSPGNKLVVNGSSGTTQIQLADSTASNNLILGVNTSTVDIKGVNGFPMAFYTANAERMRLDTSGNLGIGTSSPTSTAGFTRVLEVSNATSSSVCVRDGSASSEFAQSSSGGWIGANGTTNPLRFATQGNEKMRLDSSGNLGLGVTPGTWNTGYRAFQFGATGALYSAVSGTDFVSLDYNVIVDASNSVYKQTDVATRYRQISGQHQWFNAPSGTAGNTISFTQAMTLTAAGALGIGTASPSGELHVKAASAFAEVYVQGASSTSGMYLFDNNTEAGMWKVDSGYLAFGTTNTERARITSGGYFKASDDGTYTSSGSFHEFCQSANGAGLAIENSNASLSTYGCLYIEAARNTTDNTFYAMSYYNVGAAAYKFRVADSGNVTNTNGTYGTISDAKMKTDIVDAGSQWDDIKAVRFRKFKMKNDPSGITQLGVVAQELEQTSPGLIEEHTDRDAEGNDLGTTTKSVKTSVLLMKAAVALQEAMSRIEQLEAKVAALETK